MSQVVKPVTWMVGRISKLSHSLCGTVKTNKIRWFVRIAHQYGSAFPAFLWPTRPGWKKKNCYRSDLYKNLHLSYPSTDNKIIVLCLFLKQVVYFTPLYAITSRKVTFTAMKPSVPRTQSLLSFSSILWTSPRRTRIFLGRVSQFPMFLISINDHVTQQLISYYNQFLFLLSTKQFHIILITSLVEY